MQFNNFNSFVYNKYSNNVLVFCVNLGYSNLNKEQGK